MSVYLMTTADRAHDSNVEIWLEFPGHLPHYIRHDYNCPHYKTDHGVTVELGNNERYSLDYNLHRDCLERCRPLGPLFMEITYVGCVLSDHERNGYDDSDFYCRVWDEDSQSVKTVEYATTRGWSYPNYQTAVDATLEVKAKAAAWQLNRDTEARRIDALKSRAKAAHTAVTEVLERATAKVVKGRKVPIGFVGRVERIHDGEYGPSALLRNEEGDTHWVAVKNCVPVPTQQQIHEYNTVVALLKENNLTPPWPTDQLELVLG